MQPSHNHLGRLTAVFILTTLLLISLIGCGGSQTEPAASDGETNPPVADQTDQPDSPTDTTTEDQPPLSPDSDLASLPRLPVLGTGNRGMGGGGGGAEGEIAPATDSSFAEGEAYGGEDMGMGMGIDMPMIWNPLADAQFAVSIPFPTEPTAATVYQQASGVNLSIEEMQQYAQLFGVNGTIYQERYPEMVPDPNMPEQRPWTPPTFYTIFDGSKQLNFYDNNIYFYDQGAAQDQNWDVMPAEQAIPIVEAYLNERGLLNFPYKATSMWGSDVEIRRIINGFENSSGEIFATVTSEGNIISVSYQPFDKMQPIGNYPLRSAEEAWQYILENDFDYRTSYWFTYPTPGSQPDVPVDMPVETPWDDIYRYWPRTFNDGDPITLISYPMVYMSVTGEAAPRILVDQYLVVGNEADLFALAEQVGQPVRVQGVVRGEMPNLRLELTSWQPAPDHMWQYMPGTIRYDGSQILFDADEGETFLVPNPPADVADGERVNLSGWSIEEGDGTYRSFNWSSMDRIVDWESLPSELTDPMPVEPTGEEYKISDVNITEIALVYQYTPAFDDGWNITSFLLQPAWRFTGTTNNENEMIQMMVQAVPSDFVESETP